MRSTLACQSSEGPCLGRESLEDPWGSLGERRALHGDNPPPPCLVTKGTAKGSSPVGKPQMPCHPRRPGSRPGKDGAPGLRSPRPPRGS